MVQSGLLAFYQHCKQHGIDMDEKKMIYENVKKDVKERCDFFRDPEGVVYPAMEMILQVEQYKTKEEYDRAIDNMNKYINIKHIAMLRNHKQDEWPSKMVEMSNWGEKGKRVWLGNGREALCGDVLVTGGAVV